MMPNPSATVAASPGPVSPLGVAPGPVGGPRARRARELAADDRWIHRLDAADVAEIEAAATATRAAGLDVMAIGAADFPLPNVAARLAELRRDCTDRFGFGYLRGLPVARYDRDLLTRIYWGISRHLGDPVPQNRNGHMMGHVIDIGDQVDDYNKRLTQTAAELQFHSDSCDLVGLLCIRPAMRGGESALVSAIAVHDEMLRRDPELCHALYLPMVVDRRGEIPAGKHPWMAIPVFMWDRGRFTGYAPLSSYVESAKRFTDAPPVSEVQRAAFDLFLAICNDPDFALHIPFEAGDFQYVQNHLVFHSRTRFEDWPDPARKRHLMRIWLSLPDGRELHRAIAERWVNIERGTVRGGVNIPDRKPLCIPLEPQTPAFS